MKQREDHFSHRVLAGKLGTVLVASATEGHCRLDRTMVKSLGAREVVSFSRGAEAIEFLGRNRVDLVVSDWHLADMDGLSFVRALRSSRETAVVPALMASQLNSESAVLDSVASGCSGYVIRPYSLQGFEQQVRHALASHSLPGKVDMMLAKARSMRRTGHISEAGRAVADTARSAPASRYFKQGTVHLLGGRFDQAVTAFNKALAVNKAYAEAYEGLAKSWKGKGDTGKYLHYLGLASQAYADQDRFSEAKKTFAVLVKHGAATENPFHVLGKRLWAEDARLDAVRAWQKAVMLTPDDEVVSLALAKGLANLGRVERALEVLDELTLQRPGSTAARELSENLRSSLGRLQGSDEEQASLPSWLKAGIEAVRRLLARGSGDARAA